VYSVQKAAVVAIMEALYTELAAEGIHASVICPGMTKTNISETPRLRPAHFSDYGITTTASPPPPPDGSQSPMAFAMDPIELGERVLKGILADDLYILTHNEFAEQIREHFVPILAAMPAEAAPQGGGIQFSAYSRALAARKASAS
jgi:short-subunit dehydrogenase